MRYLLVDTRTSKIGELVGRDGTQLLLRPVRGGREWTCPPGSTREPTAAEKMHAGVAAANARSTGGLR
ncbi:hypothetical protein DB35_10750 [Streptomyces abyssalis]|uniref:Uncharacterized protein n=1 Tax=Streptomyces abyssalis TaxID=933944 RepID=A0A1E7JHS1_9ACTN|nr:hypothetical protein [Streptomyces abyssalis]OEU86018.1 hypothetical protein AN215_27150 [Streptomyces abyssalis]OEU92516.1 hypothetical protein DB35_10750 [Streptomyces abyssalis]